ncbi:MAG: DUF4886 domain-containing protein [Flavobacteriales bacterium]|nr:MAG: DUF4886 domain-containing protein [Flavobacteriales bacterium]
MKNWIKIFTQRSAVFLALFAITLFNACSKDGNPNGLPDADPAMYNRPANPGVIKILAIGNSFSEDAIESNLYEMAKAQGLKVIIGNLYIAGASLANHKANAERNMPAYQYRKITEDGVKKTLSKISLDLAILDEEWDYISFQQASPNSGQLATVEQDLPAVYNYAKAKAKNPNVKYIYHSTWAYATTSTYAAFANYNNNQSTMFNAIINVSQKIEPIIPNSILIPAGTAIQNARTSALGESFNVSDGYHLNPLGKYIAAGTWFEKIFNQSIVGNTYTGGFSSFEIKVAQNASHLAVLKPFEITSMSTYEAEPIRLADAVLVDFGNATPSPSWNQMTGYTVGSKVNLKDSLNVFVGMTLTVTERFNNINTNGATTTNTPLNMPSNVSARNFYGNSKGAPFNNIVTPKGVIEVTGLIKTLEYSFSFFGSRDASDNRETVYSVEGTNAGSASLNPSSNSTKIATIKNIKPNADGKIIITVTSGPNNVSGNGWFYLNAARITSN